MTTDVRCRATQRAGLRGVGFEFVLFALYVVVASALLRTPGGLGLAVVVAGVAVLVRVGLFSGPQLRGVLVTGCNVRSARIALPLVDVVGIEMMDRRELRRRVNADAVDLESVPPGPTEAVAISMATPEGHRYAFGQRSMTRKVWRRRSRSRGGARSGARSKVPSGECLSRGGKASIVRSPGGSSRPPSRSM
jgi:hypothetical protein